MKQQRLVLAVLLLSVPLYSAHKKDNCPNNTAAAKKVSAQQSPPTASFYLRQAVENRAPKYYLSVLTWLKGRYPTSIKSEELPSIKRVSQDIAFDRSFNDCMRTFPLALKKIIIEQNNPQQQHQIIAPDPYIRIFKETNTLRYFGWITTAAEFLAHPAIKECCTKDPALQALYDAVTTWKPDQAFFNGTCRTGAHTRWDMDNWYYPENMMDDVSKASTRKRYDNTQLLKLKDKTATPLPAATAQKIRKLELHRDQPPRKW